MICHMMNIRIAQRIFGKHLFIVYVCLWLQAMPYDCTNIASMWLYCNDVLYKWHYC